MWATNSLVEINANELLSETIQEFIGNTGNQTDAVADLFVNGLVSKDNCMEMQVIQGADDTPEYYITFDGRSAVCGSSPAYCNSQLTCRRWICSVGSAAWAVA